MKKRKREQYWLTSPDYADSFAELLYMRIFNDRLDLTQTVVQFSKTLNYASINFHLASGLLSVLKINETKKAIQSFFENRYPRDNTLFLPFVFHLAESLGYVPLAKL